jgi:hypothetical protein
LVGTIQCSCQFCLSNVIGDAQAAGEFVGTDTGEIDTDLRLWARSIQKTLTGPVSGALIRAIFGGAGATAPVQTLRRRFWLTRAALVRPMIDRAIERRQLPAGTDPDEVIRHVGAPLYYRLFVLGEPVTPRVADLAATVAATAAHAGAFVRRDRRRGVGPGRPLL